MYRCLYNGYCQPTGLAPWHQDLPYYCVDGEKTATVYVSLDSADSDVAVRFVKGSHRWNKIYHPRVFSDGSNLNQGLSYAFEDVPDIVTTSPIAKVRS